MDRYHLTPSPQQRWQSADPLAARTEIMDMVLAAARVGFIYDQLQNEKRETGRPVPLLHIALFQTRAGERVTGWA
jgi:hypothetical protein